MILDEYVEIKISKKNIDHFLNYYKDIKLKDIIKVDPKNLQSGSNTFINTACDICDVKRFIKYQAYHKNINSCPEYPIYTCDKCSHIKIKEFNRRKWGVDYFSQTEEFEIKFKKSMIEKWGVEYALQSDELKEKVKKTNLEKFGVENPFMDNEMIRTKFKEKWGVDHPSKVENIVWKIKTNTKKNWNLNRDIRVDKFRKTNIERLGVDHPNKSDKIRKYKITNDEYYLSYLDKKCLFKCDVGESHIFNMTSVEYYNRKRSNTPLCTICYPIGDSQSIKEKELFSFIKSVYGGEIIKSYRDGLEIDIYLSDLNLGFEFNGLYWHSEEWKEKNYHLDKTKYFASKGIRIIHIWEDDWDLKNDIVRSQIRNMLNITVNKIWARSCKVIEITEGSISNNFLNENHIQGGFSSSLKLGLYYDNQLVSLMTFDHYEGRKKMKEGEWNLSRFCNKLDTNVVGGASKLLTYFIRKYNPTRIISYADRDWSIGNLYYKLGFNLVNETKPDYKYIVDNQRVHKSRYKKSKLNTDLTESEYMKKSHIDKIWDCGKIKFELITEKEIV